MVNRVVTIAAHNRWLRTTIKQGSITTNATCQAICLQKKKTTKTKRVHCAPLDVDLSLVLVRKQAS